MALPFAGLGYVCLSRFGISLELKIGVCNIEVLGMDLGGGAYRGMEPELPYNTKELRDILLAWAGDKFVRPVIRKLYVFLLR